MYHEYESVYESGSNAFELNHALELKCQYQSHINSEKNSYIWKSCNTLNFEQELLL